MVAMNIVESALRKYVKKNREKNEIRRTDNGTGSRSWGKEIKCL